MISHTKKFIFIHIEKTGGTSIQNILKEYSTDKLTYKDKNHPDCFLLNGKHGITKHSSLDEYNKYYNLDDYTVFSCIRNPWDRVLSFYFWFHSEFNESKFKTSIGGKIPSMTYRLSLNGSLYKNIHLIRFENMQEDFNKICNDLDIPNQELQKLNRNGERDRYDYYNEETRLLVAEKFKDDINMFKYSF